MKFQHATAVVTGAASGLGAATAFDFARRGARVIGFDLEQSIARVDPKEGVRMLPVDVTDSAQISAGLDEACSNGAPLRIIVNCAGICPSARTLGRSGPHDPTLFRRAIEINLIGTFLISSMAVERIAQAPALEDGQRGVVINTASIAAFDGQIGQVAYAASKAGVSGMTLPLARDLSSVGIRVCAIAPGVIDTPMLANIGEEIRAGLAANVPFPRRLGTAIEYAQLAAMIVEHDYLNGETIRMDGALRMGPR